ncbi:50S ribosomal protein l1-like [Trifolium pratense]|uniref:50S ribosomal protein l1-like n=1 Tax=Trifolium pratense TaxID=57577 RepID=A0A2K3NBF2_TRIPR|nr:50S ribosomal protein l1-like [Trifolium pratense]
MASMKLLLSQARRHCFTNHPSHFHSSLSHSFFSHNNRSFSSSSESNPPFQPIPIQPVSYPVKPQYPPPPEPQPSSDAPSLTQPPPRAADTPEQPPAWTREEIRYVKDAPSIKPVSYPLRVAPLPDDKAPGVNDEMEQERKRIEAEDQLRKKMLKATEDEKLKVPFPLLIKPKQKLKPPLYDLSEAIRQVKANAKAKFDETVEAHIRLGIDSKRTELVWHVQRAAYYHH